MPRRSPHHRQASLRLALALGCTLLVGPAAAADWKPTAPIRAGTLQAPPRNETSGLAASRAADDLLWIHDDSGGEPVLHAVRTDGTLRGALRVSGVKNQDWEDVAAFEHEGRHWLLIAATGDNGGDRKHVFLHAIAEPAPDELAPGRELAAAPAYSLKIRYPDGTHDCEAVAVDGREHAAYLLTKRDDPPRLYRVPLGAKSGTVAAELVGTVPHLPSPPLLDRLFAGKVKIKPLPTAMDFAPDGSAAAVLTYLEVLMFPRQPGEPWSTALARQPIRLGAHQLAQAEALCFSHDGAHLYVASEETRALLRFDRR